MWPYEVEHFATPPLPPCYREGQKHQITAYQRLSCLNEIKACLAMGLPVVFGFAVYDHVMSKEIAKTGVLRVPESNERMLGGHAVLAVGYDDSTATVLFRNSWGASWGQAGYGTMPYFYFDELRLAIDFWAVQGTENDLYASHKLNTEAVV
jgi:C1A family cysteine protease